MTRVQFQPERSRPAFRLQDVTIFSAEVACQSGEHLEAKAMQEAKEQATAMQSLGFDTSAEVQTSRGPAMVMAFAVRQRTNDASRPRGRERRL